MNGVLSCGEEVHALWSRGYPCAKLDHMSHSCKTRQDTWRIKRTRKRKRLTGKAPSRTIGTTTEGTRDVDGCDVGENVREVSQGKRLSLELRLPLSIPTKELGLLDYILSLGHRMCHRSCIRSSPHGAAP